MKTILKEHTMVIALAVIFLLAILLTGGRMLNPQNLSNLFLQNSYVLILACGMLMCILSGGNIDLSVGASACLTGAICAQLLDLGFHHLLVIAIGLMIGLIIGAANGFLIGKVRIQSFVCTLAGMFIFRGLARAIMKGRTISITNESFLDSFASYVHVPGLDDGEIKWSCVILGFIIAGVLIVLTIRKCRRGKGYTIAGFSVRGEIAKAGLLSILILMYTWAIAHFKGIPVMAIWVFAIIFLFAFVTSMTPVGRQFYAVGDNKETAALSGIDSGRIYFLAFTAMSILAALCGMVTAARIGAVNGDTGNAFEMDAIAACFIGGASPRGGSGTVAGVIVGAALLGVINQAMSIIGLDTNWQYVVKGLVLLAAVVADVMMNLRKQ